MSHNKNKRRGPTRQGQAGLKQPHVAAGESGPLFIVKYCNTDDISPRRRYRLFLKRAAGYKFKEGFDELRYAQLYAERYLRLCCEPCKQNGVVQKVLDVGGIYDGGSNFPHSRKYNGHLSGKRIADYKGHCLICKTVHEVSYDKGKKVVQLVSNQKRARPANP